MRIDVCDPILFGLYILFFENYENVCFYRHIFIRSSVPRQVYVLLCIFTRTIDPIDLFQL